MAAHKVTCRADGCNKPVTARSLCGMHYKRLMTKGNLKPPANQTECLVEGCRSLVASRGMCNAHYKRWRRSGIIGDRPVKKCSVPGCDKKHSGKGYCRGHLWRFNKYGNPYAGQASPGEGLSWLLAHARYAGDACLIWPFQEGRGSVVFRGTKMTAARAMAFLALGDPPSVDFMACHNCRGALDGCVSPKHLRWDSPQRNQIDRIADGTHLRGERHHKAKLTAGDVRQIRSMGTQMSHRQIADHFSISKTTVGQIIRGQSWAWLED